jgi:uncharacterized RDD family membrane protein YckC
MQELTVTTQDLGPPQGWAYAGFSSRALAFSIDQVILIVLVSLFAIPAFIVFGIASMYAWPFFVLFLPTFCSVRVPLGWAYFALQEASRHQATFGKRMCGLKVTDMSGVKISLLRATVRYFAKFLSAAFMLIGFIMAAFTDKHQALHDVIAETVVLKKLK